jgi:hypothetical protein
MIEGEPFWVIAVAPETPKDAVRPAAIQWGQLENGTSTVLPSLCCGSINVTCLIEGKSFSKSWVNPTVSLHLAA